MKFLAWHMGLGDAIAFADLAVRIADGDKLIIPCWEHNEMSVRSIFVNHPNIEVLSTKRDIGDDQVHVEMSQGADVYRLGHHSYVPRRFDEDMIQWIYRTAGRDPRERFENEVVRKAAAKWPHGQLTDVQVRPQMSPYYFVHEDPYRGFIIDINKDGTRWWGGICRPTYHRHASILAWCGLLENAKYVQVIDSAFLHLTEQLNPKGKLFYHHYARPNSENYRTLRHHWNIIT